MPLKNFFLAIILAMPLLLSFGNVQAAESETNKEIKTEVAPPQRALIFPHGARLEAVCRISAKPAEQGTSIAQFVIPGEMQNLRIFSLGPTIMRWTTSPVILPPSSNHSSRRRQIENQRVEIEARLITVKARIAVWQAQMPQEGAQDLTQRQTLMQEDMPKLAQEQEELSKQLELINEELAQMPASKGLGQLVTITFAADIKEGEKVEILYSYDSPACGWNVIYDFDANPDEKGDTVNMRFLAGVWQYTGIDWDNTEITLATRDSGPREPQPLREWIVGAPQPPRPKPQQRAQILSAKARTAAIADLSAEAAPANEVEANTDDIYASWTLSSLNLPEGKSHLVISTDVWKTPLQWLARPTTNDNRVWLYSKYTLPPNQAWPVGLAQYSVNGQTIGQGYFQPKGGEVTLYFGADPRVSAHTTVDSSKQGETGIINTSQTWTGAWTYTISNLHANPVKVRVERPMPQLANENITVAYNDKPTSTKDAKEHMLYWIVDVPAHGKTSIQHSITITSPLKLPLFPDVP